MEDEDLETALAAVESERTYITGMLSLDAEELKLLGSPQEFTTIQSSLLRICDRSPRISSQARGNRAAGRILRHRH